MMRSGFRTDLSSIGRRTSPLLRNTQRFKSSGASKTSKATIIPNSAVPPPSSPPPLQKPRRPLLLYAWYGLLLVSGVSAGLVVRFFVSPSLPIPGSREDELALAALGSDVDQLDIVKWMRSQCSPSEKTPDMENHKGWMELDVKRYITESKDDEGEKTRTMTAQTLAGSRSLGIQRAFWNVDTHELVAVVWFGTALSGWPTLAHGGAVATIFEDCMSRMVAGPDASIDSIARPTTMSITYAKPTYSTNFYILRANYSRPNLPQTAPPQDPNPAPAKSWLPSWKDLTKKDQPTEGNKTVEIVGTLESIDGELNVRVKGTFPVST